MKPTQHCIDYFDSRRMIYLLYEVGEPGHNMTKSEAAAYHLMIDKHFRLRDAHVLLGVSLVAASGFKIKALQFAECYNVEKYEKWVLEHP